jgi:ADP-ribose pyrophosphatase YjhB (NUDIX family)
MEKMVMPGFEKIGTPYASERVTVTQWRRPGEMGEPFNTVAWRDGVSVVIATRDTYPTERKVVLVRAFKRAANAHFLTCPAGFVEGKLDADQYRYTETPEEAAVREAKEETNVDITVSDLVPLGVAWRLPGTSTVREHIFLAFVDTLRDVKVNDTEEEIGSFVTTWTQAMNTLWRQPEKVDVATASALLRADALWSD